MTHNVNCRKVVLLMLKDASIYIQTLFSWPELYSFPLVHHAHLHVHMSGSFGL